MFRRGIWLAALLLLATMARAQSLKPTVVTDCELHGGRQPVAITLGLTNEMVAPWQIAVPVGRFEYDIIVRDSRTRRVVWTWSRGKQPSRGYTFSLPAGHCRTNRELWDRRDDAGNPVPAGNYEIEAFFYGSPTSASTRIYLAGSRRDDDRREPPGRVDDAIASRLTLDRRTAQIGERVTCTYVVANMTSERLTLAFGSPRQFEVEARLQGATIWRWTEGRIYPAVLTRLSLAPGERKTFTASFTVSAETAPGNYQMAAYLTPLSGQGEVALASARLRIDR